MKRQRLGLTLVELLVVGLIVAVLSAVLFTGSSALLRASRVRVCAANLSQIHRALELYLQDNDRCFPPVGTPAYDGGKVTRDGELKSALMFYGLSSDQFYCPLDALQRTKHNSEFTTHLNTSYIFRLSHSFLIPPGKGRDNPMPFSDSLIDNASEFGIANDQTVVMDNDEKVPARLSAHGKRLNMLYADGHVAEIATVDPNEPHG